MRVMMVLKAQRHLVAAAAVIVVAASAAVRVQQPGTDWRAPASQEWQLFGGDWGNTRYSTLAQIDVSNVKELAGAWSVPFPPGVVSRSAPIVKGGMMYITAGRQVMALNPATGATLWTWESKRGQPDNRGLSLGEDLVLVPAGPEVVALRQKTGEEVWSYKPNPPQSTRIPTYANGVVVVGITDADSFKRGRVVGLDIRSGKELWRFEIVPEPGQIGSETWPKGSEVWKYGGGAVWMPPSIDPDLNMAYVGSGNAVPQFAGHTRPGDNLFTMSVVAMDLKTGKYRWHFQLLRHDVWEFDQATPLILYDAIVDGKPRKGLAAMRTDGFLFLLDRETGTPIFPVEMRAQKQDVSLATAPTQPFPKGADRFGPACVDRTLIPEGFRTGCYLDLWYPTDYNLTNPLLTTRLAPMAYSPRTSRFFVTGCVYPSWVRRMESGFDDGIFVIMPAKIPGSKGYGLVAAIDAKTNRIAWQQRLPYPACAGSGATATAGDLVFHAHANGEMRAFDARSGKLVWQFQTGSTRAINVALGPGFSPVAVYEVNREQHVAAVVGDSVWAFKRGGTLIRRKPGLPPEWVAPFAGVISDTTSIDATTIVRHSTDVAGAREVPYEYGVNPTRVRVKTGNAVTWRNNGKETHTFMARSRAWRTATMQPGGKTATLTFDKPGTYEYICQEHPWTIAQLIVEDAETTSGVFTEEQVKGGQAVYRSRCASCHLDNLVGADRFPALVGDAFFEKWIGSDMNAFVDRMRSMPADAPASLSDVEYVEVATFILNANGIKPGNKPLPTEAAALKTITIPKPR
jgi:glucose dehydrogenase/plastocyanin